MHKRSRKHNIDIILHEYDSLRNEILSRHTVQFHALGAFAAIVAGIIAIRDVQHVSVIVAGLFIAAWLLSGLVFLTEIGILLAARRIREIEAYVNAKAGEALLRWESDWGMGIAIDNWLEWLSTQAKLISAAVFTASIAGPRAPEMQKAKISRSLLAAIWRRCGGPPRTP